MPDRPHILIVGGGYVGMYTALRLQKKLRRNEARITVVDPQHVHDLPAVPAGGRGRLARAAARGGPAAQGAQALPGADRPGHRRSTTPAGPRPCCRWRAPRTQIAYDVDRGRARLDRADAADPGPGRVAASGSRPSARRSTCATTCCPGSTIAASVTDAEHRAPGADVRVHRRRLRRHRGVRRARGHGPVRDALLRRRRRPTTCAGCWSRRPGGSCPRSACRLAEYTVRAAAASATWTSG